MKSFIPIFLASLVLTSTIGITVSKHFCSSTMVEAAESAVCVCGSSDNGCDAGHKDGCCDTEKSYFQIDYDFAGPAIHTLSIEEASPMIVMVYHLSLDLKENSRLVALLNYKPPIPDRDIPVLIQTFII